MSRLRQFVRKIRSIGGSVLKNSYAARRQSELGRFSAIENVHDLPAIARYWSEKYVVPMIAPLGFRNAIECFRSYIGRMCSARAPDTVFILIAGILHPAALSCVDQFSSGF